MKIICTQRLSFNTATNRASWQAHELATKAVELGGDATARWLSAAAYDRWLMYQDKPQKYGTQYIVRGGHWRLAPFDPNTTDEQRACFNVPPLAEALQRAEQMMRDDPPKNAADWRSPLTQREDDQLIPPSIGGRWIASLEVPELRVVVLETAPAGEPIQPQPEPLDNDEPIEGPSELDPTLIIHRYGPGYCATQADGHVVCFWSTRALGPEQTLELGWYRDLGPEPQLEIAHLDTRVGVWSFTGAEHAKVLLLPRPSNRVWIFGGRLERPLLELIAATLPR